MENGLDDLLDFSHNLLNFRANDDLYAGIGQGDDALDAHLLNLLQIHQRSVLGLDTQTGHAVANIFDVGSTAQVFDDLLSNVSVVLVGQGCVLFFLGDFFGIDEVILTAQGLEVVLDDQEAEGEVVECEECDANRDNQDDIAAKTPVEYEVDDVTARGETDADAEQVADSACQTGVQCVNKVQLGCNEHEGELEGFGDTGDERGDGRGGHQTLDFALALLCALVHSQCGTGQTEHHNDKEHGQEQAGSGIACEKAGHLTGNDRAVRLGVRAEVKVDVRVEYVMQTDRDEQTVEKTEDEDTDSAELGNTDCEAVEYHLNGRPDKAQHIAEANGCDGSEGDNELFTGKEVEDFGGSSNPYCG